MDANTYFSFRCPSCNGRSRVASRHAGQVIVCPYCQTHGTARPDVRPNTVPTTSQIQRPDGASPATTTRFARPLEPATTATVRRERVEAGDIVVGSVQSGARATAPGMDGFSDKRPGTATVQRRMPQQQAPATQSIQRTVHVAPPPPKQGSLIAALATAALCAGVAVWAFSESNAVNRSVRDARDRLERATGELTALKAQGESQERRLAQAQVELAAERAATSRERQVVADLQRTVDKLGGELARVARTSGEPELSMIPTASAVNAVTAPGAFPVPSTLSAGVPSARRETARP